MSASEHAPDAHPGLRRFFAWWDRVERALVGVLGAIALAIAVTQVFGRYINPAGAITWAEEVIVYIMVWAIMIVASQLVRTDGQVRPDLVLRILPPGVQRWVEVFNCLVAIAAMFGMGGTVGTSPADGGALLDQRSSSDLQFPIWIYYAALPVGGALMLVRYVIRLVRYALFFDARTMSVGHTLAIAHEVGAELALTVREAVHR